MTPIARFVHLGAYRMEFVLACTKACTISLQSGTICLILQWTIEMTLKAFYSSCNTFDFNVIRAFRKINALNQNNNQVLKIRQSQTGRNNKSSKCWNNVIMRSHLTDCCQSVAGGSPSELHLCCLTSGDYHLVLLSGSLIYA